MASFEVEKGQATLILNVDKMQLAQILLHSFSPKTVPPSDTQAPWYAPRLHRKYYYTFPQGVRL